MMIPLFEFFARMSAKACPMLQVFFERMEHSLLPTMSETVSLLQHPKITTVQRSRWLSIPCHKQGIERLEKTPCFIKVKVQ